MKTHRTARVSAIVRVWEDVDVPKVQRLGEYASCWANQLVDDIEQTFNNVELQDVTYYETPWKDPQ